MNQKKSKKKLSLDKQTVRSLSPHDLKTTAGGAKVTFTDCTSDPTYGTIACETLACVTRWCTIGPCNVSQWCTVP